LGCGHVVLYCRLTYLRQPLSAFAVGRITAGRWCYLLPTMGVILSVDFPCLLGLLLLSSQAAAQQ
jgi:hypothetical protein